MDQHMKDSLKKVVDEMITMSNKDFMAMIDAHKEGDIATFLDEANIFSDVSTINKDKVDYKEFYNKVKIHFEMLCTDDIREHAYASKELDLSFQIFRVLSGYQELLNEHCNGLDKGI